MGLLSRSPSRRSCQRWRSISCCRCWPSALYSVRRPGRRTPSRMATRSSTGKPRPDRAAAPLGPATHLRPRHARAACSTSSWSSPPSTGSGCATRRSVSSPSSRRRSPSCCPFVVIAFGILRLYGLLAPQLLGTPWLCSVRSRRDCVPLPLLGGRWSHGGNRRVRWMRRPSSAGPTPGRRCVMSSSRTLGRGSPPADVGLCAQLRRVCPGAAPGGGALRNGLHLQPRSAHPHQLRLSILAVLTVLTIVILILVSVIVVVLNRERPIVSYRALISRGAERPEIETGHRPEVGGPCSSLPISDPVSARRCEIETAMKGRCRDSYIRRACSAATG